MNLAQELADEIKEKGKIGLVIVVENAEIQFSFVNTEFAGAYQIAKRVQESLRQTLLKELQQTDTLMASIPKPNPEIAQPTLVT